MRKTGLILVIILAVAALSSCTSWPENTEPVNLAAKPVPTPVLSPEEKTAVPLGQPDVKEVITVGDSQVVLRQGKEQGTVEFVLCREEGEAVLASIDGGRLDLSKCHIEPFDGEILGYEGFYLFERDANYPYSYVYYIGLTEEKTAKILFVNNAGYREEKERFETYFDEVRDIDGDGTREVISNIAYVVDGGQEACIYDRDQKGRILEGSLGDLIDCSYYIGRTADFRVWYYAKSGKVEITFYPSKDAGEQKVKKYKLNKKSLGKIKMEKRVLFYKSENLNDLEDYGSDETETKATYK